MGRENPFWFSEKDEMQKISMESLIGRWAWIIEINPVSEDSQNISLISIFKVESEWITEWKDDAFLCNLHHSSSDQHQWGSGTISGTISGLARAAWSVESSTTFWCTGL